MDHFFRHCEENYEVIDEAIQLKTEFLLFFWIAALLTVIRNDGFYIHAGKPPRNDDKMTIK